MTIKIQEVTLKKIWAIDLERFWEETYPEYFNLNVAAQLEQGNDTDYEFTAEILTSKWDLDKVTKIEANQDPGWGIDAFMHILIRDGHLQEGDYLLNISW